MRSIRPTALALALGLAAGCRAPSAGSDATAADAGATPGATLARIQAEGRIRYLVHGAPNPRLPRAGVPEAEHHVLARTIADGLGVTAEFVRVADRADLVPALARGEGDVVIERLAVTATRAARVDFTRPVRRVEELVVGHASGPAPHRPESLIGLPIHVRKGSGHLASLRALVRATPELHALRTVAEERPTEAIAHDVSVGLAPLAIIDSDQFAAFRRYMPDLVAHFALPDAREVAWAVPEGADALRAALDDALGREGLIARPAERYVGDLDLIRHRGELRVLTRNHEVTYFIHRGKRYGYDFELMRAFADRLGVRLVMIVPPRRDLLVPWLLQGRGDVIAASFTRTEARARKVAFTKPYLRTREMVVGHARDDAAPGSVDELAGARLHVPASSSYHASLRALEAGHGPFDIVATDEGLETTNLLDRVADRQIPLTVADAHLLAVKQTYEPDVRGLFALPAPGATEPREVEIGFAVRPDNPDLRARLNLWIERQRGGRLFRVLRARYLENEGRIRKRSLSLAEAEGQLSPYDRFIIDAAAQHGIDWRLMAAQAYVESRFDPRAKSWAGARGLFQVLPSTGRQLGFQRLYDPAVSARAAAKYLDRLIDRFEPDLPYRVRVHFALASYNAGYGHVLDARRLAAQKGWDPDRWFGHVEKAILLLAQPRYARTARYGYCRGTEPVAYVRRIQTLYEAYTDVAPG